MKQSEAYDKTADKLETRPWCRDALFSDPRNPNLETQIHHARKDSKIACCALGASALAQTTLLYRPFFEVFDCSVPEYNDLIARDKRQMVRALRKVAKILRAKGE